MSAEHGSHHREDILSKAPFLREVLADPIAAGLHDQFPTLYTTVAHAAGYQTSAHFKSEYVDARFGEALQRNLLPWIGDPYLQQNIVIMPILIGYELHDDEAIGIFSQEVTEVVFSQSQLEISAGREQDTQEWITSLMQYGAEIHEKQHPSADDPRLRVFRDFVNSLDVR